jgi:hypothetical protein
VVRYEDMVDQPTQAFAAIARHLLMTPTDDQLARAVALTDFARLRAREEADGFKEKPATSAEPFFRQGRSGQWRERLTQEQVERIVAAHGPVMRRFGYWPSPD